MTTQVHLDDLLTTKQAATLLGLKTNTIEIWRHKGKGPPFIKLGDTPESPVRYLRSAIMEFAKRRTFNSTSGYSPNAKQNISASKDVSV